MRIKFDFEVVDMGDEIIVVPVGEKAQNVGGILKLNHEGLEIVNILKNETTKDEIIQYLSQKYDNDIAELEGYVEKIIDALRANGLIME